MPAIVALLLPLLYASVNPALAEKPVPIEPLAEAEALPVLVQPLAGVKVEFVE